MLLDNCKEMSRCWSPWIGKDDSFTTVGATLGAANIKGITEVGQLGQGHITTLSHESVAQTVPIDKQRQVITLANIADCRQFVERLDCSHLGGKSDIDHPREYHVLVGDVAIERFEPFLQLTSIHLTIVRG